MALIDPIIRRIRPHWVRSALSVAKAGYETFAPMRLLTLPAGHWLSVVAPHPDDDVIGCGGLMALWSQADRQTNVAFLTDGEMGSVESRDSNATAIDRTAAQRDIAVRRRGEAETALGNFADTTAHWLRGPDGRLHESEGDIALALGALWCQCPPDLIAAPCPLDRHADHAVAARIVALAAKNADLPEQTPVWGYEVWSPTTASAVLNITEVASRKWEAISCHRSQLETTDYLAAVKGLGTYRAVTAGIGPNSIAEAYRVMTVQSYGALARQRSV
ncbi:PIG-L family deacetylase [Sulfitobacter sp. W027]|jgi:LmbE family N-acetylglucosaminyl deacetylase|uniref:PIG-L deacetylase family protein n=1 Tax=Sulfitobacter sp. W027 TaxID=2867025 RepID=UPI0021A57AEF|nr:PIG-L deacetylase family protein [Sulfitobacter sp. W027]UWR32285.1 PIG-L family deacetylase [Sulfitobacter sp. W027]